MHKSLSWLGKRKWLLFSKSETRWSINTDKNLLDRLPPLEMAKLHSDHWEKVKKILNHVYLNDREELTTYAMSRCLAFGPKMFRPTMMQCVAFENTSVDIPFEQYAQPYETLLIEFPQDYIKMKIAGGMTHCPRYVMSWYDYDLKIIMILCQFDSMNDRIVGILSENGKMIESLLSSEDYYEVDGTIAEEMIDFQTAQLFERIAVNMNLLIMYGGIKHTIRPINPEKREQYKKLKKKYEKQNNKAGLQSIQNWFNGEIHEVCFDADSLSQHIGFTVQIGESTVEKDREGVDGISPKPHWRRGHWASQPYGPQSLLRKPVLRPPVWVVGKLYRDVGIELDKTSVVIEQRGEHYQG